jgi:peptidoglycan/LPS O-acetylase OafA/YrhL
VSERDDPDDHEPAPKPAPEPPVMPTAAEAALDEPSGEPPRTVRYAFVVWVLAGMLGIVNSVLLLVFKDDLIDTAIKNNKNPKITNDQIVQGTTTLLWMFLVAAVVFAALFTLFAYKAQDGARRARLLLTMLCLVTVAFYFLILRTTFGLMTALLTLAATVLLYTPKAAEYFRPGKLPT